jgi:hypothetical protein
MQWDDTSCEQITLVSMEHLLCSLRVRLGRNACSTMLTKSFFMRIITHIKIYFLTLNVLIIGGYRFDAPHYSFGVRQKLFKVAEVSFNDSYFCVEGSLILLKNSNGLRGTALAAITELIEVSFKKYF